MFNLVNLLGTKFVYFLGSILLAGVISTASGGATGVNGGAIMLPDFNSAGVASKTVKFPYLEHVIAFVKANTGSTTIQYPASCFQNPLHGMGAASGTVLRLTYHAGKNPTAVGGDIGIVKGCGASFGSGTQLVNDTCTASGCTSYYTAGTALLSDADFIKFTPRAALAPGYTGRITATVENIWGE